MLNNFYLKLKNFFSSTPSKNSIFSLKDLKKFKEAKDLFSIIIQTQAGSEIKFVGGCIRKLINKEEIDDIDFLVNNRHKFALFSNAVKMSKGTERANYSILVDKQKLHIDLRYIGDNYFDQFWQQDCMNNKVFHDKGFYIMDEQSNGFSVIKTRNYGNQVQRCEYVGTHYACK